MTIAAQYPYIVITGNSATTDFNFNFEIPYQDNGVTPAVTVSIQTGTDTPITLNPTEYSITGVGNESGGHVHYPLSGSPLTASQKIYIVRALSFSQGMPFPNQGFLPEDVELLGDRLCMMLQQLAVFAGGVAPPPITSGVATFNTRTGAVTLFSSDVESALGFTPVNAAGDTMTGNLSLPTVTTIPGAAPGSPVNGEIWATASGLFVQIAGVTYQIAPVVGAFNQDTAYTTSILPAARSISSRNSDQPTLRDFGAVGDGVTDDTAAWNLAVAAVNAGTINAIYVTAGRYLFAGNTTVITKRCAIIGAGIGAATIIDAGPGTSPLISFSYVVADNIGKFSVQDLSFESQQNFVRRVMDIEWTSSAVAAQQRCTITNIDIQKHFKSGIFLKNCNGGVFKGVAMQGGPVADGLMDFGWYCTADTGQYSVDMRWTSCNVTSAKICWQGDHNLQGHIWEECIAVFSNYGWDYTLSDGTNLPEFHIHGGQAEVFQGGIRITNAAYVYISDYSIYVNAAALPGTDAIQLVDVIGAEIHDNVLIGPITAWNAIAVQGTSSQIKIHDNNIGGLGANSFGIILTGAVNHVYADRNNYYNVQDSTAQPWSDSTFSNTNYERGSTTNSALIQFSRTVTTGFIGGAGLLTNVFVVQAQAAIPVYVGQQYRVQVAINVDLASVDQSVLLRVREYTHRPGSPNPYNVFYVNNNRTSINDDRVIVHALPLNACRFYIDTVIRIIGAATDALFVVELENDTGSATIDEVGLYITLL